MPKVSVIMPAYNAEKYINEAIDSILGQTFGDFELIIINDCSADSTENIIQSYSDSRIVYLKNEKNMGVAATLNRGLEAAGGEYIARMDADDISLPQRLEKQVNLLDADPSLVACGSQLENFCDGAVSAGLRFPVTKEEAGALLVLHPTLAHPTVMLRGTVLRENRLRYDLRYEGTEDFALWWEISRYGSLVSLDEVLLRYRVHVGQATRTIKPEKIAVFIRFAAKRLEDLGVPADMAGVLYEYTCDTYAPATRQETEAFILMLRRMMDSIVAAERFDRNALRNILSRCAMRCIHASAISEREKMAAYRYARQSGLLDLKTAIVDGCRRAVRCFR